MICPAKNFLTQKCIKNKFPYHWFQNNHWLSVGVSHTGKFFSVQGHNSIASFTFTSCHNLAVMAM